MMQDIPDPANRKPDTPVAFDRTVADEPAAFPISIADFEKTIRTIDPGIITPGIYERNSTLFEPQRTGSCRSETPPRVEEPSIGGKLGERQVLPEICSGKRYRFTDLIGAGGEGTVFSAYDDSFGREIAVKVLRDGDSRERLLRFLREARTMALLEHPNIVPVYDIELADDGEVFFTMRKIKGITLGEAIRAKSRGENIREIDAPEDIVSMFLKVCDALAFAHNRGVIHHDVKPDNIVLGPFGEVLLLDWGSSSLSGDTTGADAALSAAFPRLIGTPAYMSPEQARAELITERSDVYCLGATMFHTLTLRHPAWGTDVEQFWEKKRTGTIDPLKPGELQSVPHQLIAIVLKAIEPNPADRYGSIIELADDLKRFLTGRAIGWRLLFEEQFESGSSDALEHDWIVRIAKDWANPELAVSDSPGGAPWRAKDGSLTGACEQGFAAVASRKKIQGNMRIEWIAMSRAKNENLNCFIAGETRLDGYAFHVGGFGFANQVILTKGKNLRILDMAILDEELQALNPYTFRMEKEVRSIRLFINNAPVIEYEDPDVLGGPGHQTFGFEVTGGNMVEIRDVRVFYQPLPLAVSPLAIADSYFENRLYDQALVQCREILTAYPDTNLAKSAGYKIASVKQKLGDTEGALGAFEQFEMDNPRHPLATPSMYERSRILRSVGRTEDADRVCRRLAEECPGQPVLRMVLYDITASLMETCPVEEMEKGASALRAWASALGQPLTNNLFLEKYASLLADKKRHAEILEKCSELRARCARVLLENLGRPDRVLTEYPDQRKYCALALNSLNRYRETLVKYPEQRGACANALYACNDLERVLSEYPEQRILCVRALGKLGRVDEIIAGYRDLKSTCASNLTYLGQIDKVASLYHDDPTYQVWILYASGQFEELLERYPGNAPWCAESLLVLDRPHEVIDTGRCQ